MSTPATPRELSTLRLSEKLYAIRKIEHDGCNQSEVANQLSTNADVVAQTIQSKSRIRHVQPTRFKRTNLSLRQKLILLDMVDRELSYFPIAKKLAVSTPTVTRIVAVRESILASESNEIPLAVKETLKARFLMIDDDMADFSRIPASSALLYHTL